MAAPPTALAAAPAVSPVRPEFMPRPGIGPNVDPLLVHAAHPTETVANQITSAGRTHGNGEGLVGLQMTDANNNVYEVTDHNHSSRTRETIGASGLGFRFFSKKALTGGEHPVKGSVDLFGGPGFIGNARVTKSVREVVDMRTVKVTGPNGGPVKYLHFSTNEQFSEFLNYNTPDPHAAHGGGHGDEHGHHGPLEPPEKVRLRTPEPPLGFKEFGWKEQITHYGTGDTIPVPASPDAPVSVAALEAQRRRLDLASLEHVTWTDAAGNEQTIVWDGVETEKQTGHEVGQRNAVNKLPRDLRNEVTYGKDGDPANAYINAERDLRTVKVATRRVSPEHPDPLKPLAKHNLILKHRKKSAIAPDEDPGGTEFVSHQLMTLDELQAHFNKIAAARAKNPHSPATDAKWNLPPADPNNNTSLVLRQEELHLLRAAGIPADLGRFALSAVGAVMPSRERATDPGVSPTEAMELLLKPDFVDVPGGPSLADWNTRVTELADPLNNDADAIQYRISARHLQDTIDHLGSEAVGEAADDLLKDARRLMGKIGLKTQAEQLSISWAYQQLSDRHINASVFPDETRDQRPDGLTPGDPLEPSSRGREVRRELVEVIVGTALASASRTLGMQQQHDASGALVNVPVYNVTYPYITMFPIKIQKQLMKKLSQDPANPLTSTDMLAMGSLIESYWDGDN